MAKITFLATTTEGTVNTEDVKVLRAAINKGEVGIYTVRSNGSTRRMPYLKQRTEARKLAQTIVNRKAAGETMKVIAADLHLSVPSVRRLIVALGVTKSLEKGIVPTQTTEDVAAE